MAQAPAARPDSIRRHNLGVLLGEIHRHGELTRAALTQRLGVNRSTVGALVTDLTELGWLAERVPSTASDRAGRPSYVVGPRPDGPYVLAVDVEVDRITVAAVGVGGSVLARRVRPISGGRTGSTEAADIVTSAAQALHDSVLGRLLAVGVAIPASISRQDGRVLFAPNLRWEDQPFAAQLAQRLRHAHLDVPVDVGNDANLGAMAEHIRGVARGHEDVVYLVGKIGVGAGLIAGGRPLGGSYGLAGEAGHMVLDGSGPQCHCGNVGCVEMYIGDAALLQAAGREPTPDRTRTTAVLHAAREGEPAANAAVRQVARDLGRTVATLVNLLDPQLVIMGGTLADVLDMAPGEVRSEMDRSAVRGPHREVELSIGGLGADASLLGAAELAFAPLVGDPLALAAENAPVA